ncbi:hypothetical protein HOY82DRAFT_107842 [Tuber indicum]|nr:hypothetical protein HOY82DRAFT_107842 [Tuber indicum]
MQDPSRGLAVHLQSNPTRSTSDHSELSNFEMAIITYRYLRFCGGFASVLVRGEAWGWYWTIGKFRSMGFPLIKETKGANSGVLYLFFFLSLVTCHLLESSGDCTCFTDWIRYSNRLVLGERIYKKRWNKEGSTFFPTPFRQLAIYFPFKFSAPFAEGGKIAFSISVSEWLSGLCCRRCHCCCYGR